MRPWHGVSDGTRRIVKRRRGKRIVFGGEQPRLRWTAGVDFGWWLVDNGKLLPAAMCEKRNEGMHQGELVVVEGWIELKF